MALSSNKARELRRRQAEKARRAPTMKPSIQARKQAEALTKRAPVNRFGSATPKANTGRTVTKNNNFDKFQKQVADNTAVTKTGNFATDRRNNNKISEQFGATSNIPESNVTQSETDRRNRASDKNLGINQNNPFLGRDPNTIVGGTVAQSEILAEQARINKGKQDKGFSDFKKNLQDTEEVAAYRKKLEDQIAEQKNRNGKASDALMEHLGNFEKNSTVQRIAISRGINPTNAAALAKITEEFRGDYEKTGEFKALQDEGQTSALDLANRARQSTFGGSTLTETQVRDSMGLKAGQNLFWNEESTKYEVRTGAIENSDPFVRAEEALQLKKDNAIEDVNEQYKNAISRAEANVAQYGNNQARTHLADLLRRKKKSIDRITEQVDTSMEELVIQEEQRQSGIEEVLLAGDEPLTTEQQGKLEEANWIAGEQAKDPSQTVDFLKNKWKSINKYEEIDPKAKENIAVWDNMLETGLVDLGNQPKAFQQALDVTGDAESAYEMIKATGDTTTANELRSAWTEEKYGTAAKTRQELITTGIDLYAGEERSGNAVEKFVEDAKEGYLPSFIASQLENITKSAAASEEVRMVAQDYLDSEYSKYLESDEPEELDIRSSGDGGFVQFERGADGSVTANQLVEPRSKLETGKPDIRGSVKDGFLQFTANEDGTTSVTQVVAPKNSDGSETGNEKAVLLAQTSARSYLESINNGELTFLEAVGKIGTTEINKPTKDELLKQWQEQGSKRVMAQDSAGIAKIEAQISGLEELLVDDIYQSVSGMRRFGFMSGKKGNALAIINQVLSQETLNSLIGAKADGATFGALSEGELGLLAKSANALSGRIENEDENNPTKITGFSGSEAGVKKDIKAFIDILGKAIEGKTGQSTNSTTLNIGAETFNEMSAQESASFEGYYRDNTEDVTSLINDQGFTPNEVNEYYQKKNLNSGADASSWRGTVTGINGSKFNSDGLDYVLEGDNRGYGAPIPSPVEGEIVGIVSGHKGNPDRPLTKEEYKDQNDMWGNQVIVKSPDGRTMQISHMADVENLKVGQTITKGEILGTQGNTGRTYSQSGGNGAHLDIVMRESDESVIPPKTVAEILKLIG